MTTRTRGPVYNIQISVSRSESIRCFRISSCFRKMRTNPIHTIQTHMKRTNPNRKNRTKTRPIRMRTSPIRTRIAQIRTRTAQIRTKTARIRRRTRPKTGCTIRMTTGTDHRKMIPTKPIRYRWRRLLDRNRRTRVPGRRTTRRTPVRRRRLLELGR